MANPTFIDYEAGISAVDARYVRPMMAAVHVIVEGGRAALVGHRHQSFHCRRAAGAGAEGRGAEAVDYVMLTTCTSTMPAARAGSCAVFRTPG